MGVWNVAGNRSRRRRRTTAVGDGGGDRNSSGDSSVLRTSQYVLDCKQEGISTYTNRVGVGSGVHSITIFVDGSVVCRVVRSTIESGFFFAATPIQTTVSSAVATIVLFSIVLVRCLFIGIVVVSAVAAVAARALVGAGAFVRVLASTAGIALFLLHLFFPCTVVRDLLHPLVRELLCHVGNAVKQNISQRRHVCGSDVCDSDIQVVLFKQG